MELEFSCDRGRSACTSTGAPAHERFADIVFPADMPACGRTTTTSLHYSAGSRDFEFLSPGYGGAVWIAQRTDYDLTHTPALRLEAESFDPPPAAVRALRRGAVCGSTSRWPLSCSPPTTRQVGASLTVLSIHPRWPRKGGRAAASKSRRWRPGPGVRGRWRALARRLRDPSRSAALRRQTRSGLPTALRWTSSLWRRPPSHT